MHNPWLRPQVPRVRSLEQWNVRGCRVSRGKLHKAKASSRNLSKVLVKLGPPILGAHHCKLYAQTWSTAAAASKAPAAKSGGTQSGSIVVRPQLPQMRQQPGIVEQQRLHGGQQATQPLKVRRLQKRDGRKFGKVQLKLGAVVKRTPQQTWCTNRGCR